MDRQIIYPGQIPLDTDLLYAEKFAMIGIGQISRAALGITRVVDGLECTPTTPASMVVQVAPGTIFEQTVVDQTAFGTLASDTGRSTVHQGIWLDTTQLTLTAPATVGHAINYLIQAALSVVDDTPIALPYYNSADPTQPYTGPNNSGVSQNTVRRSKAVISAKAGVSATSGTQVTPTPDAGYAPLYVVTVTQGQTQITSGNISQHQDAPTILVKLPDLPRWVQGGTYAWALDTGTANAMVVSLSPRPLALAAGMKIAVKKMNAANTGAMTVNVNGLGAVAIVDQTGAPIGAGNMTANFRALLMYDGTSFVWINGSVTNTTVSSLTAISGEGITVSGGGVVSLNFPGLTNNSNIANNDPFAYYNGADLAHRTITYAQLLAKIMAAIPNKVTPDFLIRHQVSQGTAGGAMTAINTWQQMPLNTSVRNVISGASLGSNQFTLPAGTYKILWKKVCYSLVPFITRLYNVTDAAVVDHALNAISGVVQGGTRTESASVWSEGQVCDLVLTVPKTFQIEGLTKDTFYIGVNTGLGNPMNYSGVPERYAEVEIYKVG